MSGAHGGVESREAPIQGPEYLHHSLGGVLALPQRLPQEARLRFQGLHHDSTSAVHLAPFSPLPPSLPLRSTRRGSKTTRGGGEAVFPASFHEEYISAVDLVVFRRGRQLLLPTAAGCCDISTQLARLPASPARSSDHSKKPAAPTPLSAPSVS